jgi:DNA-binding MurR/RpiR family transcriptional regulator
MARKETSPDTFAKLTNEISERYPSLSKRFQQIARYLTQNPNTVALQSVTHVAGEADIHASSLVRFAQHLGYSGFKEMQTVFQTRLMTAAPGFNERIGALEKELRQHTGSGDKSFLRDLVVRDIASLEGLMDTVSETELNKAVSLMKEAGTIYVVGQLRSEPVAIFLRYVLTMLRRRVILLDSSGGLAAESARIAGPGDVLIAISFRHYAQEVAAITEIAATSGAKIIAITDSQLSPLAKSASVLFAIHEEEYTFSRSQAAPMCLAQALTVALASALQPEAEGKPRIPVATEQTGVAIGKKSRGLSPGRTKP